MTSYAIILYEVDNNIYSGIVIKWGGPFCPWIHCASVAPTNVTPYNTHAITPSTDVIADVTLSYMAIG